MVNACTIIARNYLAHARVLADSFHTHHPDGRLSVLIVDDEEQLFDGSRERFECLRLADVELERAEIMRLAGIYDVTELATAVKPLLLRHLLEQHSEVIYLDPDIRIYGSLEGASMLAAEHGLVLTPHMTAPLPRDGRRIDEFHILAAGVYNLGFIGVSDRSNAFIDWWWQKTRRDALSDPGRMMFTDQRWVDFVPSLFDHFILKDPTFNVAYWNLHSRQLTWSGGSYFVDGQPLTFFHFSGLDAQKPHLLSKHQGDRPRILLSEHPALARICGDYLDSVKAAGLAEHSAVPYGWDLLPSGLRFDLRMRRLYREGLVEFEKGNGPEPPAPFDHLAGDRFIDWLNEPVAGEMRPRVSRYLKAIYQERPDLQRAFPDLGGADRASYFAWLRSDGVAQLQIPEPLLPTETGDGSDRPSKHPSELVDGVNIVGYFRAEVGVGEAARLLSGAVEAARIPHSTVTYADTPSRKSHEFLDRGDGRALHHVNIVCVNADRLPLFAAEVGGEFFAGRYTAGYWFWELEQFPAVMHRGFDYVDEVWTATEFVAQSVRATGRRPVHLIPLPVPIPICSPDVTRVSLRLPASFMFLFMFDFFSVLERKNPIAVIKAFSRAFRPGEGPILVLKTINGDSRLNDLEKLRAAAGDRSDVLIVDDYYSSEEKNALLGLCDCYVSLHRSEGLGLTMAEAMGLGKPVIATAYSGNLHFMTSENSYLVDYTRVAVGVDCEPYPPTSTWADPNIDQAAELMRRVYEARAEASSKAQRARHDILTRHNVEVTAAVLKQRLDAIGEIRTRRAVAATLSEGAPSGTVSPDQDMPPVAPLEQLFQQLTPQPSVAVGRRFRAPLLQAQRLLFKVLRPYWFQQRHIQALLLQAVRQLADVGARASAAESVQRQSLQAAWAAIQSLRSEIAILKRPNGSRSAVESAGNALTTSLQSDVTSLRTSMTAFQKDILAAFRRRTNELQAASDEQAKRTTAVQTDVNELRGSVSAFQADATTHLNEMTTDVGKALSEHGSRATALQAELVSFRESVEVFQKNAKHHLGSLNQEVNRSSGELTTLLQRLYAQPFMADRSRFLCVNRDGQQVLGFRGRRERVADVYAGFEDVFRGPESLIRERFHAYLPLLERKERVLDIGCGRGELLDLLRDSSVPATGIDIDAVMVERCRRKGHVVEQIDAVDYLRSRADRSLPAIFAAQVVEHFPYDKLLAFLEQSREKLTVGGQLIFETVNPHALEAFKTFHTDLTHHNPIFPEVAIALCWLTQFDEAYVFYPNGTGDEARDRVTQGEYAVIASIGPAD